MRQPWRRGERAPEREKLPPGVIVLLSLTQVGRPGFDRRAR